MPAPTSAAAAAASRRCIFTASSRLLKRLRRWQPASGPGERLTEQRLSESLARSFDDGTPHGADTAAQFERLCAIVGRLIASEHSELTTRLQRDYRRLDPGRATPDAVRRGGSSLEDAQAMAQASELCGSLHRVLRDAGFELATMQDEERAKVRASARTGRRQSARHSPSPHAQLSRPQRPRGVVRAPAPPLARPHRRLRSLCPPPLPASPLTEFARPAPPRLAPPPPAPPRPRRSVTWATRTCGTCP